AHPLGGHAVLTPQEWTQALAPTPDAARSLQPTRRRSRTFPDALSLVRLLDAVAVLCGLAVLSTLVYWWWRPEEVFLVLLGVLAIRLVVAPLPVLRVRPRRAVAVGVTLYAVYFSAATLSRHWTFRTHALDLGYYVQLTWNLARGAGPYVSLPEMHAWGDHFSPIMYLFVPAFWLAPGPGVLLVAQSIALALGGLAVFALATQRLGDERPAAVFCVLYLINPSLHGINVRDFHSAALVIPLVLAAIYFAETNRPWLYAVAVLLTLATREDAAIAVVGLGLWRARRSAGGCGEASPPGAPSRSSSWTRDGSSRTFGARPIRTSGAIPISAARCLRSLRRSCCIHGTCSRR